MTAKTPAPIVLTGQHVRLEPLTLNHVPDLAEASLGDEEVWRYARVHPPQTEGELHAITQTVLDGPFVPFAVVRRAESRAIGWTCYLDVQEQDERLEIGWTWYGRAYWRTAVNTEAKLLLLTHAFEDLGFGRVQWKTDARNTRSRSAVQRLGAAFEGIHRREHHMPDGSFRDTAYFSLLGEEWPAAKARLVERLAR
jgi:RimJ/RimL family protein N-acetyltransferase